MGAAESNAVALARREREKAEQRRLVLQAVELRGASHSFRSIADIQGCSIKTATKRYHKGIHQYVPDELVEAVRKTELDRFDVLTMMNISLMGTAYKAGDIDTLLKLQDRVLAVHDRRKKLVPIEVPQRLIIDQTVATAQDDELSSLLSGMESNVEETIRRLQENRTP